MFTRPAARIAGLLLAAGSGRRYGRPKALVDTGDGPWVVRAIDALAGCNPISVVVGARADEVAALLPAGVRAVRNDAFEQGMGSSLRCGLQGLVARPDGDDVDAVVVMLVDLPDVGAPVVRRILASAGTDALAGGVEAFGAAEAVEAAGLVEAGAAMAAGSSAAAGSRSGVRSALVRASYAGRPGHPVLLGRDHWPGVLAGATGDEGARRYLVDHQAVTVECGDLASGRDIDRPIGRAGPPPGDEPKAPDNDRPGATSGRSRPVDPLPEVSPGSPR